MKRYITEFLGTFFLTFIVAMTGNPLVIVSEAAIMVYVGINILGAHYNPAISLAIFINGKFP